MDSIILFLPSHQSFACADKLVGCWNVYPVFLQCQHCSMLYSFSVKCGSHQVCVPASHEVVTCYPFYGERVMFPGLSKTFCAILISHGVYKELATQILSKLSFDILTARLIDLFSLHTLTQILTNCVGHYNVVPELTWCCLL